MVGELQSLGSGPAGAVGRHGGGMVLGIITASLSELDVSSAARVNSPEAAVEAVLGGDPSAAARCVSGLRRIGRHGLVNRRGRLCRGRGRQACGFVRRHRVLVHWLGAGRVDGGCGVPGVSGSRLRRRGRGASHCEAYNAAGDEGVQVWR